jgi:heterodisulfide reductase subunit A2
MKGRRIGVYICHCGGNISDYVDVEKVREAVSSEEGVVVAKRTMFACSDSGQQEIIDDIKEQNLDGIVVASCSPKLHLYTFRGVAARAGLNPYQYIQVNLREQDSWAHTRDPEGATEKGIRLVLAGIKKAKFSTPLEPIIINTIRSVLVIGAGIAGLRAAIFLADLGMDAFVIEKEAEPGGWVRRFKKLYPHEKSGEEIIKELLEEVGKRENITLFTEAELIEQTGYVGDFKLKIRTKQDEVNLNVGAIIVATGFDTYKPKDGEYGYGAEGVVDLPQFKQMVEASDGKLTYNGKEVKNIAYIYCVGARQKPGVENANVYCSRYCCNAALHTSILVSELDPSITQFHLYRDIRTYGKYELLYEDAAKKGAIFLRFSEDEPPEVEKSNGDLLVRVKDLLTAGAELEIGVDLVVLVTAMVPNKTEAVASVLKIPIGRDRFFNEIHPKLRPVETVINGVFIAGACQFPRNSSEAVASSLAAAAKSASLLLKGYTQLEPSVAIVNAERCKWCGLCEEACPYSAIEKTQFEGREIAVANRALCKGCGACVPVCPEDAIDIEWYTDSQVRAMIEGLAKEIEFARV